MNYNNIKKILVIIWMLIVAFFYTKFYIIPKIIELIYKTNAH